MEEVRQPARAEAGPQAGKEPRGRGGVGGRRAAGAQGGAGVEVVSCVRRRGECGGRRGPRAAGGDKELFFCVVAVGDGRVWVLPLLCLRDPNAEIGLVLWVLLLETV